MRHGSYFMTDLTSHFIINLAHINYSIELLRALFLDGEDKPPRLKDESAQAWILNTLANCLRPERTAAPRRSAV